MKILMVFSSPSPATAEYSNMWSGCPTKRDIDAGQLVIEGNEWKVFVYDGQDERFCDINWKIDQLEEETRIVKKQFDGCDLVILLHGDNTALDSLRTRLTETIDSKDKIKYARYSSAEGTFYDEDLKHFASNPSISNFEEIWKVIEEIRQEKFWPVDVVQKVRTFKHNSYNIAESMETKITSATKNLSILLEFEKYIRHIKELEKDRQVIEHDEFCGRSFQGEGVKILLVEILDEIQTIAKNGATTIFAFNSACNCLKKMQSIHSISEKAWKEVTDG